MASSSIERFSLSIERSSVLSLYLSANSFCISGVLYVYVESCSLDFLSQTFFAAITRSPKAFSCSRSISDNRSVFLLKHYKPHPLGVVTNICYAG